jgi:uncharacterized protein (TIGR03435 family)
MRFLFLLLLCSVAHAQEFEVASIKATEMPTAVSSVTFGTRSGPGTDDPTHITSNLKSLRSLVLNAFGLKPYQLSAPDSMGSQLFNISAVLPEGTTREQVNVMWQNLLIKRFGMKSHWEQREFASEDLLIGPRGHKLKENAENAPPVQPRPTFDAEGRPTLPGPGLTTFTRGGPNGAVVAYTVGRAQAMSTFAGVLEVQLGHPVVDKTGLTGKYDFTIEFTPPITPPRSSDRNALPVDPGLSLPDAVQQQLGLRLVKGKTMRPYLVIDSIEKIPSEN